jgi:HlyD family secretion protein
MKRKIIIGLAVVGLLSIPFILKLTRGDVTTVVEVEKVTPREIKSSILASGFLVYEEQVQLSPEVLGKVSAIFVKEGQQVQEGEVVLTLNDQSYRAAVAQQQASVRQQLISIEQQQLNVANQERQYKRKDELHKMKMIPDSQVDDALYALNTAKVQLRTSRESLQQAEAQLKQTNEQLAKTNIRAPLTGTVTSLDIKVGETAIASQVGFTGSGLMTIANTATMITEINVDETDIGRIKVGQDVDIFTAAYPETALKGQVQLIPMSPKGNGSAAAQAASLARNYKIKVKMLDTKGLLLRPGMTSRAEIYTAIAGKSLALPIQAVLSNNDENATSDKDGDKKKSKQEIKTEYHVFVMANGIAEKRVVSVGISDDSHQEIKSGLKENDTVIVGPYKILRRLKDKEKVKLADEKKEDKKEGKETAKVDAANSASASSSASVEKAKP